MALQCNKNLTFYYENPITNDPKNPYGIDFIVYDNSYIGDSSYAEPVQVYVSENGHDWYALAGSFHYEDFTDWNRSMTYKSDGTSSDGYGHNGSKGADPRNSGLRTKEGFVAVYAAKPFLRITKTKDIPLFSTKRLPII